MSYNSKGRSKIAKKKDCKRFEMRRPEMPRKIVMVRGNNS
jgi:hypothetical protein